MNSNFHRTKRSYLF